MPSRKQAGGLGAGVTGWTATVAPSTTSAPGSAPSSASVRPMLAGGTYAAGTAPARTRASHQVMRRPPPSGGGFDVRERGHLEQPQPGEARLLVDFYERSEEHTSELQSRL